MRSVVYTLIADGSSDRALDHLIRWALRKESVFIEKAQWADPRNIKMHGNVLSERVKLAWQLYPADMIFIHRDAESCKREERLAEIAGSELEGIVYVPVVPVRMTEAWLLHDESAIRRAAGNPNGSTPLRLPSPSQIEKCPNPKNTLFQAFIDASDLHGRRRDKFKRVNNLARMRARTAELIDSYDALRDTPAFSAFLNDLRIAIDSL